VKAKGIAAYLRLDAKTAGCVVEDISAGGLFLRTDRVVPVGTAISLDLVDPEVKRAVTLTGQVVGIILKEAAAKRGGMPGLRIRFNRQAGATHEYLQKLMARLGAPQDDAPVFYAVTRPPPRARREPEPEPESEPPMLFPVERTRQGVDEGQEEEVSEEDAVGETHVPSRSHEVLGQPTQVPRHAHVVSPPQQRFSDDAGYDGPGLEERTILYERGPDEPTDDGARAKDREAAHKAEVATLRLRVAELEAEIGRLSTALEQQMAQSEEHLRELRAAVTERDRKIAELKDEANALRGELAGGDAATPTPVRPAPRRR
jgi:hypothetical protein